MLSLAERTCAPCRGGVPPLERDEAEALRTNVKDWELLDDAHRIERRFAFKGFREALCFVVGVGELAEAEHHHPNVSFGWGVCDGVLANQENQGIARERLYYGGQDRSIVRPDASPRESLDWVRAFAVGLVLDSSGPPSCIVSIAVLGTMTIVAFCLFKPS